MSEKPLSYTECVHRVLRAAPAPMTMDDLIQAVGQMRPLTAKNIRSTLGNVVHQSSLVTSLGDGRYWWMPHLLKDNHFRLRPSAKDLELGRLPITDEAKLGLWPGFFGARSRERESLVRVELADGPVMERPVEVLESALWGFKSCPELAQWYKARRVRAGDDLILTVIDADAPLRCYRLAHESAGRRDDSRLKARNRQLADAAYALLRRGRAEPLYYLAPKLAARGFYSDPCPPTSLEAVLQADDRFRDAGLMGFVRADDPDYAPSPLERILGRPPRFEDLMGAFLDEVEPEEYTAPPTDREVRDSIQRLMTAPLNEDEADGEIERLALAEEKAVTELMRFVAGRDRDKHRLACQILVRLESDLAVEPLRQRLRDSRVIDDYKVDIITALVHLGGLLPGENPFEYLRDAEGAMRRTQQEFLDMMRDPLDLCNFVQENIEDLPFFQSPEQFQDFVATGGSETFPLLLCLLHAPQNQVVISAVEAMESLQLPEAVPYLEERAAYDSNRKVRRAAQRVAERLTGQVGRWDETPTPPAEPLLGCFVSSIDGSGGQIVVIAREAADGQCKFLNVMFNDHEGIKDCFGGLSPTLEEVQEFIGSSFAEMGIELVDVSLERARDDLVRARQIVQEAHRRLPPGFMAWRHWALGDDPKPPKVFPLPEIQPDEREALLAECDNLLDLEEFGSWFFNVEDLHGLDRSYRRLYDEESVDVEQEEALVTQGVRRVVDKARRQLLRNRLRRQAWLLAQIYEEGDIPGMALAAADGLEDDSPLPPEEHPLLRAMMLDSFFNAVGDLFE